jgi:hypothetical protein
MNKKLIKILDELRNNYESHMNIHMNELHFSCKSDVHNIDYSKPLIKKPYKHPNSNIL